MPTKKMNMPKVEVLKDTDKDLSVPTVITETVIVKKEEVEKIDPPPVNEVAETIEVSVIIVPLGTNHRQVRIAFDVRTNKVQPSDIPVIVETVLTKAAPMVGEKLIEIIGVEKNLLNATTQE